MSKYETNKLGYSSIFQDMIISELEYLNKKISRDLLKDFSMLKTLIFNISEDCELSYNSITKSSILIEEKLVNNEIVFLEKDEIEAYFHEQDNSKIFEEYPLGLNHEFLEIKEPKLFNQLKILKLLKKDNIKEILSLSLNEKIGALNG